MEITSLPKSCPAETETKIEFDSIHIVSGVKFIGCQSGEIARKKYGVKVKNTHSNEVVPVFNGVSNFDVLVRGNLHFINPYFKMISVWYIFLHSKVEILAIV